MKTRSILTVGAVVLILSAVVIFPQYHLEAQGPDHHRVYLPVVSNGFVYVDRQDGSEVLPDPISLLYAVRRGAEFEVWDVNPIDSVLPPVGRWRVSRPVDAWGWRAGRIEIVFRGDEGTYAAYAVMYNPRGQEMASWCLAEGCGIKPTPTPEPRQTPTPLPTRTPPPDLPGCRLPWEPPPPGGGIPDCTPTPTPTPTETPRATPTPPPTRTPPPMSP